MCHFISESRIQDHLFIKKTSNPNIIIISINSNLNKSLPTQKIQHIPVAEIPKDVEPIIRDIAGIKGVVGEIIFSSTEISLVKNNKIPWRKIMKPVTALLENYNPG